MDRDVLLAVVLGAHGLKGDVRLKTFTEMPDALSRYGAVHAKDGRTFRVSALRPTRKDEAVAAFAEIASRDDAEALKGLELFVSRDALPVTEEDEFYHADLVGMAAEDQAGRAIGTVKAIHNFGAGDVIEIARSDGDTVLLPFSREFVPTIDVQRGRLIVAAPEDSEITEHGNVE